MSRIALVAVDPEAAQLFRESMPATHDLIDMPWRPEYAHLDPVKVADALAAGPVDVVCLLHGIPVEVMLTVAEAFDNHHPEIPVLVQVAPSAAIWARALRSGVRDVVPLKAGRAEVGTALDRAVRTAARRRATLAGHPTTLGPTPRVVTVVSPKGGSGKTMLATNLAVGLAAARPGRVAIVDFDTHFGDVAAALALTPEHSLADVAASRIPIDSTMAKVFLSPHASGLYALCAPETPAEGDQVTPEHAANVVRLLSAAFPVVIVDTAAGLDENTLAAIELTTDLVMVASMDVASVRSMRKEIDALDRMGMVGARRHFILNRADAKVGLAVGDIEEVIGLKAMASVPSSRSVPLSMNRGSPVLHAEPRSAVARALQQLVDTFDRELAASDQATAGTTQGRSRRRMAR